MNIHFVLLARLLGITKFSLQAKFNDNNVLIVCMCK